MIPSHPAVDGTTDASLEGQTGPEAREGRVVLQFEVPELHATYLQRTVQSASLDLQKREARLRLTMVALGRYGRHPLAVASLVILAFAAGGIAEQVVSYTWDAIFGQAEAASAPATAAAAVGHSGPTIVIVANASDAAEFINATTRGGTP